MATTTCTHRFSGSSPLWAKSFSPALAAVSPPRSSNPLFLPPFPPISKEKVACSLLPQASHDADRTHQEFKIQQQKQQQHLHLRHHHLTIHDNIAEAQRTTLARAVAQHVYRANGIRGFYRGLSATILRDVGGNGLYFLGYEATLRLFTAPAYHAETLSRSWAPPLVAGAAAGILGWLGTFPFDMIKTCMQAQDIVVGDVTHTSSFWCAVRGLSAEAVDTGGGRVGVFWRGFVPTVVRAVPVNMAVFVTFEGIVWAFS